MSSDVGWLGMAPQSSARCVQHIVTELCGVRASSEGRTSNICSRIVQKPCLIPTQQHTQHAHRRSDKYSPCRPAHKGDTSRDTQQCETHTNHDEYNSPLLLAVEPVLRDCTAVRMCEGCTVQVGPHNHRTGSTTSLGGKYGLPKALHTMEPSESVAENTVRTDSASPLSSWSQH